MQSNHMNPRVSTAHLNLRWNSFHILLFMLMFPGVFEDSKFHRASRDRSPLWSTLLISLESSFIGHNSHKATRVEYCTSHCLQCIIQYCYVSWWVTVYRKEPEEESNVREDRHNRFVLLTLNIEDSHWLPIWFDNENHLVVTHETGNCEMYWPIQGNRLSQHREISKRDSASSHGMKFKNIRALAGWDFSYGHLSLPIWA